MICNHARSPEIDMEDVKGAAERPWKDWITVAHDCAIESDAMRALKDPIGDIFAAMRPKESETDMVRACMTS